VSSKDPCVRGLFPRVLTWSDGGIKSSGPQGDKCGHVLYMYSGLCYEILKQFSKEVVIKGSSLSSPSCLVFFIEIGMFALSCVPI
jgi:hypothetical protein